MIKPERLARTPLYADKIQLLERIENLRQETESCGFQDISEMLWAAHAKLKSKRIRKS